jgi:polygalacturonase
MSHILAYNLKANGTNTGVRLKSAKTRGGHIEHFYVQDLFLDSVRIPFTLTLDWNPSYSYSKLPEGYVYDSIPDHWKVMLQKVEPEEKGIPSFSDIYVDGLYSKNSRTAISAVGLEESILNNFNFTNVEIESEKAGKIGYAKDWKMNNVTITAKDNSKIEVVNSENINWN